MHFAFIYILIYVNGTGSGATFFENTLAKVSIFFLGSKHTIDFALISQDYFAIHIHALHICLTICSKLGGVPQLSLPYKNVKNWY